MCFGGEGRLNVFGGLDVGYFINLFKKTGRKDSPKAA
jgi:hypothetical protein